MTNKYNITTEDMDIFVADALCDIFNDAGISYNGQAFTRIGQIVKQWAEQGILADGTLDIGDYYE